MTSQFWISWSRLLALQRLMVPIDTLLTYVFGKSLLWYFFAIRNSEDPHNLKRSANDITEYILIAHFEHTDFSNTNLRVFHTSKQVFFFKQSLNVLLCANMFMFMAIVVKNFYILLYPNKNLWSLYLFESSNKKGRNNGVPIRPVPCTSNNICPSHNQHNGTTSLSRPSTSNNSASKTYISF